MAEPDFISQPKLDDNLSGWMEGTQIERENASERGTNDIEMSFLATLRKLQNRFQCGLLPNCVRSCLGDKFFNFSARPAGFRLCSIDGAWGIEMENSSREREG